MSESWCNFVFGIAVMYIMSNWLFGQELYIQTVIFIGVLLIEIAVLWHYAQKYKFNITNQSYYRPNASSGVLNVLLVPLTLMGELGSKRRSQDSAGLVAEMWLSLAVLSTITMRLALIVNPYRQLFLLVICPLFFTVLAMVFGWISLFPMVISYMTWKCLELVPLYAPKSFTFGELAVVLQLFASWLNRIALSIFQGQVLLEEDIQLVWFVCTILAAVIIATVIVYLTSAYSSLWHFVAVYIILAASSLMVLQLVFTENPVLWLLKFVCGQCTKVVLFVTWIILLAIVIVWTVMHGLQHLILERDPSVQQFGQTEVNKDHLTTQDSIHDSNNLTLPARSSTISFTQRKVFHVFIVLVYFPGLVLDMRLLLLASTAAFGLFIILEAARVLSVPLMGEHLDKILRTFVDDRDQGLIFLTHIYLLVGMSLPLWISHNLFSSHTAPLELYSGVLSLGVGDTVACVAGKAWGRIHWPGSEKTIEGTLCSVLAQLVLVIMVSYIGVVSVSSWLNVFIGIFLSASVEAFTDQIDNLILPLVLYPFLCMS